MEDLFFILYFDILLNFFHWNFSLQIRCDFNAEVLRENTTKYYCGELTKSSLYSPQNSDACNIVGK